MDLPEGKPLLAPITLEPRGLLALPGRPLAFVAGGLMALERIFVPRRDLLRMLPPEIASGRTDTAGRRVAPLEQPDIALHLAHRDLPGQAPFGIKRATAVLGQMIFAGLLSPSLRRVTTAVQRLEPQRLQFCA